MESKEVRFEGQGYKVTLRVKAVTALEDTTRSILISQGIVANRLLLGDGWDDTSKWAELSTRVLAENFLRTRVYPSCIAALSAVENDPDAERTVPDEPTFEDFATLPGELAAKWERTALELNPHWAGLEPEDEEGKEPGPSGNES